MNKRVIFFLLLASFLALILPAGILAQTTFPPQATNPANLSTPPGITRMVETISTRLQKGSETVRKLQTRISSRLEKMREVRVNVSNLEIMVQNSQTQIEKLTTDLSEEEKLKEQLVTSEKRKATLIAWRKQVNLVRGDLLSIIKLQKKLIVEMKKALL